MLLMIVYPYTNLENSSFHFSQTIKSKVLVKQHRLENKLSHSRGLIISHHNIKVSTYSNKFANYKLNKPLLTDYFKYPPPFTERVSPVINVDCSSIKNNTAFAISSGFPRRPTGIVLTISSSISCFICLVISVAV